LGATPHHRWAPCPWAPPAADARSRSAGASGGARSRGGAQTAAVSARRRCRGSATPGRAPRAARRASTSTRSSSHRRSSAASGSRPCTDRPQFGQRDRQRIAGCRRTGRMAWRISRSSAAATFTRGLLVWSLTPRRGVGRQWATSRTNLVRIGRAYLPPSSKNTAPHSAAASPPLFRSRSPSACIERFLIGVPSVSTPFTSWSPGTRKMSSST